MDTRPIITNGDHAANALRRAFPGAFVLPWRDTLVEGPVPLRDDEDFADLRARHLAQAFGHDFAAVRTDFAATDRALDEIINSGTDIALWFETDLADQLQILLILNRLARVTPLPKATLLQLPPPLPSHDLASLAQEARPVTSTDYATARRLWAAVRQPTPEALAAELVGDGLPVARNALGRLLEELPSPADGLGRIERETLRAIAAGATNPVDVFRAYMRTEDPPFLGDASFFDRFNALAFRFRLIAGLERPITFDRAFGRYGTGIVTPVTLTTRGRRVLSATESLASDPAFDRWVGGTHLVPGAIWCFDPIQKQLIAP